MVDNDLLIMIMNDKLLIMIMNDKVINNGWGVELVKKKKKAQLEKIKIRPTGFEPVT